MPNIILKNRNGEDVIYNNILSVTFDTDDGGQATYVYVSSASTSTTASINEDGTLLLNNAEVSEDNTLTLKEVTIDESGNIVIDKE